MPLKSLVEAEKTIPVGVTWTEPDKADGYVRFSAPLEIDGVVEASLSLIGGAYGQHPDCHVTLELAVLGFAGDRRIRLARIDWKSLRGGHSNSSRKCSGPHAGRRVPETHLHSSHLNYVEAEERMKRGKLPCAEPIPQPLQSFEELRKFAGTCFRIKNIDVVPAPNWVYDLFRDD